MGEAGALRGEPAGHAAVRQGLLPRDHYVTVGLGIWIIGGMYADAVAHNIRITESFFSPEHVLIYSGFLAMGIWLWWLSARLRGVARPHWAIPVGYELAPAGALMVLVSGMLDGVWHTLAGPEVGVEVLVSPTHAVLLLGTVLIVLSPFRAVWADTVPAGASISGRAFLPALLSITLGTMVIVLAFLFIWPFFLDPLRVRTDLADMLDLRGAPGQLISRALWQLAVRSTASSIMLSNLVILAPILLMVQRWRLPYWSLPFFLLFTTVGFYRLIPVAVSAGLLGVALTRLLRSAQSRAGYLAFAAVFPIVWWGLYLAAMYETLRLSWSPHITVGLVAWTGIAGMGLAVVMSAIPPPPLERN